MYARRPTMPTSRKNKRDNRNKTEKKPMSLAEKAMKSHSYGEDYIDPVNDVSDEEIRDSFFPKSKIMVTKSRAVMTCDSCAAPSPNEACEYNGPVPLGFREMSPLQMKLGGIFGRIIKHFGARNFFLGDQINGWFMQNTFVYKACSMPGDDAVACGYEIVPRGTSDKKLLRDMMDKFNSEEFNLDETMRTFDTFKRGYGGAILIPCFEEKVDMSMPLIDYSQLKGNRFIGWTNVEPYYVCPVFESGSRELTDPTYKFYMCPTYFDIYGGDNSYSSVNRVHRSWVFFRRNIVTAKIYQPMYKYLGPSIPQMILERLYSAEVCANESSMLLRSKRTFFMEANIRKIIANPKWGEKFLKTCQYNADNWGIRLVPPNSNVKQMDCYLSECMPLTTAQYGILCAEVEIPAPKFMMAQLTGFANSGNYEIKLYANNIKKLTTSQFVPLVRQTIKYETACLTGSPAVMDVRFGDVDIPTVVEQAEILYEQARASKFAAEAKAIKKGAIRPNSHKTAKENSES